MTEKTLTITQAYHVNAPVPTVFRALTDPDVLKTWFLADAHVDPKAGGSYEFTWQGGYKHEGKVLGFVRNRLVKLSWPSRGIGDTRVTFTVRRDGTGTILEVRHTGYKRSDAWLEMYGGTESGWAYYLMNLKSVLEHGHDLRAAGDTE
ncbi:MAG: SRPBCC domain-containing protein [Thermoplasmata archaeon]